LCHYKTPRSSKKGDSQKNYAGGEKRGQARNRQETPLRVEGKKGTVKKNYKTPHSGEKGDRQKISTFSTSQLLSFHPLFGKKHLDSIPVPTDSISVRQKTPRFNSSAHEFDLCP